MKRAVITLLLALALLGAGCGKNGPDCFQASGDTIREVLPVAEFSNITVFENIQLVLRYGPEQEVVLETGENLRPDISVRVVDGTLELRDGNNCNFFRSYGKTICYITSPDLEVIRSSTGWPIRSEGTLPYRNLRLIAESFNNPETATTDGSFDLDLDVQRIQVVANGIAYFRLSGQAEEASLVVAAGDARIEAGDLVVGDLQIDHRGSNEMQVYPTERISGTIRGYGDVLSLNRPDEIAVEEIFRGRLIFID
jgi:hypothetical protein